MLRYVIKCCGFRTLISITLNIYVVLSTCQIDCLCYTYIPYFTDSCSFSFINLYAVSTEMTSPSSSGHCRLQSWSLQAPVLRLPRTPFVFQVTTLCAAKTLRGPADTINIAMCVSFPTHRNNSCRNRPNECVINPIVIRAKALSIRIMKLISFAAFIHDKKVSFAVLIKIFCNKLKQISRSHKGKL